MRNHQRRGGSLIAAALIALVAIGGCRSGEPGTDQDGEQSASTTAATLGRQDQPTPSRAVLDRAREQQQAPGAIFAIRRLGSFDSVASGMADIDNARPMAATDHFFIGSATKTFAAVILLQLVDEGLLSLDDSLATYRPEFPRADAISIRHLLNHTSGVSDYAVYFYYRPWEEFMAAIDKQWTVDEMLEVGGRLEPFGEPGELFAYSATNYALVAAIIEQLTGESFQTVLRERIFEHLRMNDSWLNAWEPSRGEVEATGYLGPVDSWPHSDRFGELGPTRFLDDANFTWAAGGIVSTAVDATGFLEALFGGELLSEAMMQEMQSFIPTPTLGGVTTGDEESFYGLGVLKGVRPSYTMIGHGGLFNGYSTLMMHIPECDANVALFANRGFINMRAILDAMLEDVGCTTRT